MFSIEEIKSKNKYYERLLSEIKMDGNLAMANDIVHAKEHQYEPAGADIILFRASSNGHLMVEPKGKSNFEKWEDACINLGMWQSQYENFKDKNCKSAIKKLEQIKQLKDALPALEAAKNDTSLSETVITHLIDVYIAQIEKRKEEVDSKFLRKGNECEEDSITLFSRVTKKIFKKNVVRLCNEFVSGEWDLSVEENGKIAETIDIKTSFSRNTHLRAKFKELNSIYYWQGITYMWLTGATKHTVAYCLVNGTAQAIMDEKRKLGYKHGMVDGEGNESEDFKNKCKQIEINHIFDLELFKSHNPYFDFHNDLSQWNYDIPKEKRVFQFTFERNENDIERLKNRIIESLAWINVNLFNV